MSKLTHTPNTTKEVEEVARNLGHEIIEAIKDFQENGRGTLWLDRIILKHLTLLTTKHQEELEKAVEDFRQKAIKSFIRSINDSEPQFNDPEHAYIEDSFFKAITPTKTDKKYPDVPCAHGVSVNEDCIDCSDSIKKLVNK